MRVRTQRGYSLIELVVVVTVLTAIAAIVVPTPSSTNSQRLDVAAGELAMAVRFAQGEALRTGAPHGFEQTAGTQRIRLFRLDTGASPPTPIYDVLHPLGKRQYDIDLQSQALAAADAMTVSASFRGACVQADRFYFDANGTPWCTNPATALLESWTITLSLDTARREVRVDGLTGRVSLQ